MLALYILLKKHLPTVMTQVANCSIPVTDCNSFSVHFCRFDKFSTLHLYLFNFSFGSFAVLSMVSSSMPRKVKVVDGPSVLLCAIGSYIDHIAHAIKVLQHLISFCFCFTNKQKIIQHLYNVLYAVFILEYPDDCV